ncbi:diguanylate cyclase [Marinicella sp. W31]|uniref:GGDEF domain-containing protein n=1 Tax=Marinicella sp. W31 TaxID=3023713 RepID=UPI003758382F
MQISNADYVSISLFLINIMMSVIFWLTWKTIERKPHTLLWSLLFAVAAINGALNAINQLFPNRDIYWVIVNAISLLAQWLAWSGFRMRAGRSPYDWRMLGLFITAELLVIWFTLMQPHMGLRMVMIPYVGFLVMLACAWEIYNNGRKTRPAEIGAMILFSIYGLVQAAAGTAALMQGAEPQQIYLNWYSHINFLLMPAAFTGLGLFTVLILVDDLGSRMRHQAITDQLTGLLNRRGFYDKAHDLQAQAQEHNLPIGVIIADIDHFKNVNDNFGHQIGDQALQSFAELVTNSCDPNDVIGRIGGEEFAFLLYSQDLNTTQATAEQIRTTLQQTRIHNSDQNIGITASFGIAELAPGGSIIDALKMADHALYRAKTQGRNRVEATV